MTSHEHDRADHDRPVTTDQQLEERWSDILGEGRFAEPELWVLWFDEHGVQLPTVVPIDDLPAVPGESVDGLVRMCRHVLEGFAPGGSVALALCRPGRPGVRESDRAWARSLYAAAAAGFPMRQLHLATAGQVRPLVLDDAA